MPELFHNPYHFVPLSTLADIHPAKKLRVVIKKAVDKAQILPDHVTHARFVPGTHSGTIRCRLTTLTPLIIGAQQAGNGPKTVEPYRIPGTGEAGKPETNLPGIPGSSLRGLISFIVEATTASALRVLDVDRRFSYRKEAMEGLSALGLVVERKGPDGKLHLHLYPLAEPHKASSTVGSPMSWVLPKGSGDYSLMFPMARPKIYFSDKPGIRNPAFLAAHKSYQTGSPDRIYAIPRTPKPSQKIKVGQNGKPSFDLGLETTEDPVQWNDELHSKATHIRGILRVLGVSSTTRAGGMGNRKHEFFFPLTAAEEKSLKDGTAQVFPIQPQALNRFQELADERTLETDDATNPEDLLPYTPHGQNRGPSSCKAPINPYHLKEGDIVFFRPNSKGDEVSEVSLSSIWRDRMEKADSSATTLGDLIAEVDKALLPMGHPDKTHLTPAELLFGYVEDGGNGALASRLRFTAANPEEPKQELLGSELALKVLASPKPPSPKLYFRKREDQGPVQKGDLNTLNLRTIQGRKGYLHHPKAFDDQKEPEHPWLMHQGNVHSHGYDKLRIKATPIPSSRRFTFEIHFDNLSDFELGALIYALRPNETFRHKLGLGKPIGLGSVQIDPCKIERVDRYQRYAKDELCTPRVHHTWERDDKGEWNPTEQGDFKGGPKAWLGTFCESADKGACTVLKILGDPASVQYPVHYPQVLGPEPTDATFEQEHYAWFVANEHIRTAQTRKYLAPISDTVPAGTLPMLPRLWLGPVKCQCSSTSPMKFNILLGKHKGKTGFLAEGKSPIKTDRYGCAQMYYCVKHEASASEIFLFSPVQA